MHLRVAKIPGEREVELLLYLKVLHQLCLIRFKVLGGMVCNARHDVPGQWNVAIVVFELVKVRLNFILVSVLIYIHKLRRRPPGTHPRAATVNAVVVRTTGDARRLPCFGKLEPIQICREENEGYAKREARTHEESK